MIHHVMNNKAALGLAGLIAGVVGVYVAVNWNADIQAPASARAPGVQPIESIPGGPQTPEYDRLQRLADGRRAQRALEVGGSAVPTPPQLEALSTDPSSHSPPRPPSKPFTTPPSAQPKPTASSSDHSGQRAQAFASAMHAQMKGLMEYRQRFAPAPTRMVMFEDTKGQREQAEEQQRAARGLAERPRDQHGLLKPGDMLHAVLQTAINSDEPGPVRAKVVGERFKGAILLGRLTSFPPVVGSRPARVLVQFDYLTTPDRATYPIDAYAIDTATARTALATDVDHHILERWGSLVAASFLEGYGNAVRASHSITTVGPLGNIVSVPKDHMDHEEVVREALGTVGERMSDAVGESFKRPNTITVDAGIGIGVLIVTPSAGENGQDRAPVVPRTARTEQRVPLPTSILPRRHMLAAPMIEVPVDSNEAY